MDHKFQTYSHKIIYVFSIEKKTHHGLLKIGETSLSSTLNPLLISDDSIELNRAASKRIDLYTKTAGITYELLYTTVAINNYGSPFKDNDVHRVLKRSQINQPKIDLNGATEWFKCDLQTVKNAIQAVKSGRKSLQSVEISDDKTPIIFRPEQKLAIRESIKRFSQDGLERESRAHMLWNAKMRFGKTLSALQVVKEMNFAKTIIVTHRPVVRDSWYEDFEKIFYDKPTYKYVSRSIGEDLDSLTTYIKSNEETKYIYFASIQDLRGSQQVGGKYEKNKNVFDIDWDFVIIDEAHEGTQTQLGNDVIEQLFNSSSKTKTLYLSGTPFNLLSVKSNQSFSNNEIFTWDYVMEQRAKLDWVENHFDDSNPYESLPKLSIFTYDLSRIVNENAYIDLEDQSFNFKEFFKVHKLDDAERKSINKSSVGRFVHEEAIIRFLDLLTKDDISNYPFSNSENRNNFRHTLWMLPGVRESKALSLLLREHSIFGNFDIVNVAGNGDEEIPFDDALKLVKKAVTENPESSRSITISCGRLTTGVTVPAWTAVLMLSGSSATSASSYLQTIFRVQTPANIGGKVKTNCFVFDFAPDRTLKMVAEASNLSIRTDSLKNDNSRMEEFLNFCPIISVEGSAMKAYNTESMLVQLKRAIIDRVAKNGFDDPNLYNDNLLNLSEIEINNLAELKRVLHTSKSKKNINDIKINLQGLDNLQSLKNDREIVTTLDDAIENKERERLIKERRNAILILRGIAIRIPLLMYGANVDFTEKIDINSFPDLIDPNSWYEFMPKGVSKDVFSQFSRYFDNEVFVQAGLKIRRQAKAADNLNPIERVVSIARIFSSFKNPDKETVLTPWKVVNAHLGETIGGANFYDINYELEINVDADSSIRWADKPGYTSEVFNVNSRVLEINSKSGLYPLYSAASIFQSILNKGYKKDLKQLWFKIIKSNIFVISRTKMAEQITRRTLIGYHDFDFTTDNIIVMPNLVTEMAKDYINNYSNLTKVLTDSKTWNKADEEMKFNAVIGNPPYQSDSKQQIYVDFYLLSRELGDIVSLIFPVGWQEPKKANNLQKLNNIAIKSDKQIVFIDNRKNIFPGIPGAEWTNFILWKKNYDNGLSGKQRILVNGKFEDNVILLTDKSDTYKPKEIDTLVKIVSAHKDFKSFSKIVSSRKPYGLGTDFLKDPSKYDLPLIRPQISDTSLYLYGLTNRKLVKIEMQSNYPLPKKSKSLFKFKIFVPYAWGNMDISAGLGGAYSDIIIAGPNDLCTESYLEQGCYDDFDTAKKHAKYLMTKFVRACLYKNKYSQHSTTSWSAIPLQDYKEPWWNKSILEIDNMLSIKYKLPEEVSSFILLNIQEKDETSIINF